MNEFTLLRRPAVERETGLPRSSLYALIAAGLFTRPVGLGRRSSAWPHSEIQVLNAARIANLDDFAIRRLVKQLEAARLKDAAALLQAHQQQARG